MITPNGSGSPVISSEEKARVDAKLVKRFNNGDESAFVEIMERHWKVISGIAYNFTHNYQDAEDIAQDTFIIAHRALARFRGDSSFSTWLHCIVVNLSRNRLQFFRRRHKNSHVSIYQEIGDGSSDTFLETIAGNGRDPAELLVIEEFVHDVESCIKALPLKLREVLFLRLVLNLPYREIAKRLGISVGTVKSRIGRGRECLRASLGRVSDPIDARLNRFLESPRRIRLPVSVAKYEPKRIPYQIDKKR